MAQEIQHVAEAAQAVAETSHATGGLGTLGINLKIFIAQLINFVVVLLVLWKWAYKPIVNLLDKRSERIEKSLKEADEIEKRLSELDSEQKALLAKAKQEANEVLEAARAQAESQKASMLDKAKGEVQTVVEKGKIQLQAEKEQMLRDAKSEIVAIAVEATKKILEESIDEKASQKIAEGIVEKMTA